MFVFAVSSTGVFCRPSCPARRPRRENVQFFEHATAAEQAGYRACLRCRPKAVDGNPQSALVREMCRYIEQNIEDRLTLAVLAGKFRRSTFHLQRMFKSVLGVSPKAYIDACRLRQVKQSLQAGHDVTTSLYAAGYGSSSRLYERTASQLGMTPEKYRRGAVAAVVRFTIAPSPLGRMLIAATDKGICAIQFADSDEELQQGLMREFPFAARRRDDAALGRMAGESWATDGRAGGESGVIVAARHSRDGVSAARVGAPATDSARADAVLQRGREKDWHAEGDAGGGAGLRDQSSGDCDSVSSGGAGKWRTGRISVGHSAEGTVAGDGERSRSVVEVRG